MCRRVFPILAIAFMAIGVQANDWPMWRHDAGRTASTKMSLPNELHLQWVRELPPLKPAFRNRRLQFDKELRDRNLAVCNRFSNRILTG